MHCLLRAKTFFKEAPQVSFVSHWPGAGYISNTICRQGRESPNSFGKGEYARKKKKKTEKKVLGGMKEGNRKPIPCALGRLCILD